MHVQVLINYARWRTVRCGGGGAIKYCVGRGHLGPRSFELAGCRRERALGRVDLVDIRPDSARPWDVGYP